MSDDINAERVPLLETQEDLQNPVDCKEQCCCCLFSIMMILLLIISVITNGGLSYTDLSTDISKIPYEYKLRYKSLWGYNYIIEGHPTEFNGDANSFSPIKSDNSNQPKFIKYAELIVPFWVYGNFNVIEFRRNQTGSVFPVSTVNSRIDNYLTNEIDIVFTASDDDDLKLESCEYRISWSWLLNGYIWRLCENLNESVFNQVAIFTGHPSLGLTFSSVDEKTNYGYSSRAAFFWDLYERDIFIDKAAPFPPIIPALYTAYYNYLEYMRQRNNRRED
ncbi:5870_t:CDS:2 [Cetraspora pellucida]|uniref:5870_t:CDS:1 n=1 Tax=Cetraspora pellucida TaxID=1433469 RepID=A0A9N9CY42_9GLOM|nr:5870_t:CDS:2 [Cetraspora pellucida]